jgi:hypothetical protein
VDRRRERDARRRERRERRSEEFWLREQQGLFSPGTEEYSSSDEEEESRFSPIGGSLHPRHRSRLRCRSTIAWGGHRGVRH